MCMHLLASIISRTRRQSDDFTAAWPSRKQAGTGRRPARARARALASGSATWMRDASAARLSSALRSAGAPSARPGSSAAAFSRHTRAAAHLRARARRQRRAGQAGRPGPGPATRRGGRWTPPGGGRGPLGWAPRERVPHC